jgi:catechol 2,3-dioxygenase-like lactoylglutathione lyase family enzyme
MAADIAIPILRIFDEAKALEFYIGYLGFHVNWENRGAERGPLYMEIERGGMRLHLSEHYGDGSPGAAVFVVTTGVVAFHAELQAKHYPYLNPGLGPTPWGSLCMDLLDPFGNRLSFNEYLGEAG